MARFDHTVFVCTHERPLDDPRGSCTGRGAQELVGKLKALTFEHELQGRTRVMASGCHDRCDIGCSVAIFSAGAPGPETWYGGVRPDDAPALFEKHVLNGERFASLVQPTD